VRKRALLLSLCLGLAGLFGALGVWQLERLGWKRALIARVEARLRASPTDLPPRALWPRINARDHEYRRVTATGVLLNERETLVDALTEQGPGYWVMTPLQRRSDVVLVNRGFVPAGPQETHSRPQGQVRITGLMRMSEPDGRILRPNRPAQDLFYSRDVAAIAARRGLEGVAPFFIDAEATGPGIYPRGGMTVVTFRNAHLAYALTWFALAALALFGAGRIWREPAQ
jgi:surfeit locus 1 family protein